MSWLELPGAGGFPNIIRLPLGVSDTDLEFGSTVHSDPLPQWVLESLPPQAVGHPEAFIRDAKAITDAVAHYLSTWFS